jgi:acetyl esterase/lipase
MRWVCIVAAASLLTLSCGGDDTDSDAITTTAPPVTLSSTSSTTSSTTSTTASMTSTTVAIEGPVAVEVTEDVDVTSSRTMDVYAPTEGAPWPVVVLWHGQPPTLDAPNSERSDMAPLAAVVAEQGAVVFNVSYGATTPAEFVNDNGCSLQLVVESAADFGGDPERVVVVGNSFGGAAALVWGLDSPLRDEQFTDCVADADSVQVLPDAVVAVASGTNPRNLQVEAWQQADDAILDAGTPILLVGGNPDLQAFFATQEGAWDVFALPEDSIALHEALLASGYESTLVELTGVHGTAILDFSPEFPRLVDLVLAAVDAVR